VSKFAVIIQLAIGLVFLVSSAGKLWDRRGFTDGLIAYRIIPQSWARLTSVAVIALEVFIALSHLTGYFSKIGFPIGLGLISILGIAVGVNLKRGRSVPCYCFGTSESLISTTTLVRLALLAAGEAVLLALQKPIRTATLALPNLLLALFWSTFVLLVSLWLFAVPDTLKVLRIRTGST
jgi:hypothetical protein